MDEEGRWVRETDGEVVNRKVTLDGTACVRLEIGEEGTGEESYVVNPGVQQQLHGGRGTLWLDEYDPCVDL